ncbi:hypothetical protein MGYG_06134 [Nannizzia gypsea CBS 118893]|uniref:Uncharacterized protein n=1 Tax=Arthroderma gypseum (strain ATCC MYA-4604 / CBS 118893) TaxID=535722 RepID=E4V0K3_ARTGP|nr:hypothetical protein MGYG_06134 [Nannizzia gypsea CBS 118893]EFR03140.1 hypothetical protein MGYG_06134 [Nannizzia gypsea CBS 118893]
MDRGQASSLVGTYHVSGRGRHEDKIERRRRQKEDSRLVSHKARFAVPTTNHELILPSGRDVVTEYVSIDARRKEEILSDSLNAHYLSSRSSYPSSSPSMHGVACQAALRWSKGSSEADWPSHPTRSLEKRGRGRTCSRRRSVPDKGYWMHGVGILKSESEASQPRSSEKGVRPSFARPGLERPTSPGTMVKEFVAVLGVEGVF